MRPMQQGDVKITYADDGTREVFPNSSRHAAFDDDPLSFFDALEAKTSFYIRKQ